MNATPQAARADAVVETAVQTAVTALVRDHPFYGTLLLSLPLVATGRVPSFATCGAAIYYNPEFVAESSMRDLTFILVHELEHIVRSHADRQGHRIRLLWNMSADFGINQDLIDYGLAPPKKLNKMIGLYNPEFRGLSSEAIYSRISEAFREGNGLWADGKLKQGQLIKLDPISGDVLPKLRAAFPGIDAPGHSGATAISLPISSRHLVSRAVAMQSDHIPKHLRERLGVRSQVDWPHLLEKYIRSHVRKATDWSRLNRRTRHLGLRMPGGPSAGLGSMALVLDVSGSMLSQLSEFLDAMDRILDTIAPQRVIALLVDSDIRETYEGDWQTVLNRLRSGEIAETGGGDTDLKPAFLAIEYMSWTPDVAIILTDMESPWPEHFSLADRTVFVTSKKDPTPPFGNAVAIN